MVDTYPGGVFLRLRWPDHVNAGSLDTPGLIRSHVPLLLFRPEDECTKDGDNGLTNFPLPSQHVVIDVHTPYYRGGSNLSGLSEAVGLMSGVSIVVFHRFP